MLASGLVLRDHVPQGHKVALEDFAEGATIRRYNVPIGYALKAIPAGSWVHERLLSMPAARRLDDNLPIATVKPEPQPPQVPVPGPPGDSRPSTEQLIEQLKGGGGQPDEAGARLVAMNLALDGKPREEVERRLAEDYALEDSSRILDDVYSRVGK